MAGSTIRASLDSNLYAPGYQYDIIRRKRGHLGIGVQVDLFDSSAKISAAAQVVGGQPQPAVSARGSSVGPDSRAGPEFRLYLTNSPKFLWKATCTGCISAAMATCVSSSDTLGLTVAKHLSINAGYQLGSRLVVNNSSSSNRIGVRLTQHGAIAGLEFSF